MGDLYKAIKAIQTFCKCKHRNKGAINWLLSNSKCEDMELGEAKK